MTQTMSDSPECDRSGASRPQVAAAARNENARRKTAHRCLSRSGGLAPISLLFFQGARLTVCVGVVTTSFMVLSNIRGGETRMTCFRQSKLGEQRPLSKVQRGDEDIQAPQQMVCRDHLAELERIEQLPLIAILPTHHRRALLVSWAQLESPFAVALNAFFDSIDPYRTSGSPRKRDGDVHASQNAARFRFSSYRHANPARRPGLPR
jgi:hypothetical protein